MKGCVIVTGGGSGGHLFTLQSVCREIKKRNVIVIYIGREHALERDVLGNQVDRYYSIPVGKLRRNWSVKIALHNLVDGFKIVAGLVKSFLIVHRIVRQYPQSVAFSAGGFVAIPPIVSCFLKRIPIVIHEQTAQAGLANRISGVMADTICTSFEKSGSFFQSQKTVYTGFPLREVFYQKPTLKNLRDEVKQITKSKKPVILFSGGSHGSQLINEWVKDNLDRLLKKYTVWHQTGVDFLDEFLSLKKLDQRAPNHYQSYHPIGFVSGEEWSVILRQADVVIGRSGAGMVHECIHLRKKAIFIPLAIAQKNEQYHNAVSASHSIEVVILKETDINSLDLLQIVDTSLKKRKKPSKTGTKSIRGDHPVKRIADLIFLKIKNR